LITPVNLNERTRKDLEQMAKRQGISGWRDMRKDQLVRALRRMAAKERNGTKRRAMVNSAKANRAKVSAAKVSAAKINGSKINGSKVNGSKVNGSKSAGREVLKGAKSSKAAPGKKSVAVKANGVAKPSNGVGKSSNGTPRTKSPLVAQKIKLVHEERERLRDLTTEDLAPAKGCGHQGGDAVQRHAKRKPVRDRLVLMVRDSYWLQACWQVNRASVERARAAMCEFWHTAKPVLRLVEVDLGSTTSTSERVVREIEVHGGVNNWYLDVHNPPKSYRVDLGYLAANGRFHSLIRSNAVTTPRPGANDALDQNWADVAKEYERVYAMSGGYNEDQDSGDLRELFEERLNRSMESPLANKFGVGADASSSHRSELTFDVEAELVVYGRTKPDAHVSLAGQPVRLREDGTFAVRKSMPDKRQVLPIVAGSRDGLEQRTIILAIERNTKVMEPVTRDTVG